MLQCCGVYIGGRAIGWLHVGKIVPVPVLIERKDSVGRLANLDVTKNTSYMYELENAGIKLLRIPSNQSS